MQLSTSARLRLRPASAAFERRPSFCSPFSWTSKKKGDLGGEGLGANKMTLDSYPDILRRQAI